MAQDTYIEFFTGMLGGGKTYNAVIRALAHMALGGHVYTNVTLKPEACRDYLRRFYGVDVDCAQCIHELTHDQMQTFPDHIKTGGEVPVLLICDEAHLLWSALDWSKVGRKVMDFLTLTRKMHVHIILITQHPDNVAKQFRRMVQFFWTFRDWRKLRIPVLHLSLGWLPIIQCVCVDPYSHQKIRNESIMLDPSIFPCYETRQLVLPMSLEEQQPNHVRKVSWDERWPRLSRRVWGGLRVAEAWSLAIVGVEALLLIP
ncbi:MAG: hypothetical protein JW942_07855 [Opitutales bacterium]|nr:hypothetical protein [Opitutales bacterium]